MRLGVFCTYENPLDDYVKCFQAQTRLVQHVESLGFEEAWVAEHHFNPDAASPSILVLLAWLAGVTKTIRLGSAAVLLPFRNPIQVAEDVASIDILSGGRFDFGVAKGGPFPLQNKHFHADKDVSRDMTIEALELIERLFAEEEVTFSGQYYQVESVRLAPKPLQNPMPVWIATTTPEAIRYAAKKGIGVMGGSPFPLQKVVDIVETYRAAAPGVDPRLALARFYFAAPTREQALAEAQPFIARFSERMRGIFMAQGKGPGFDADGVIARSLIGSYDEVIAQAREIQARAAPRALLLKPASLDADKNLKTLTDFARIIRPALAPSASVA
ncbi:LLM class flavin-dependent oxidoreductase [Rhodoblastus sphagnicola]|uniref:LLM class flavin-dependent oxidoreductase n=1 Tax=Rhodoblastus sphagnicola TaxID=333368 RepID=A0A2S6NDI0_9HYPH|nr:LLM class flavin-dependent oxidoreductase [Rhodoblastus sphagnicola]MBB4200047.1 alkanesulfonate monooxygenase SsuD/methylene tetrahydromethanopterin reductase-like flavin-dependent oxidoreductase (luciferase family) [Rhodoblastus sphagnicola]PPQ32667.1 LLM class flavin-dependent oxidoreductase [Rhodoblastus sphagnicola]